DLHRFAFQEALNELQEGDKAVLRGLSFFDPSSSFEGLMSVTGLSRAAEDEAMDRLDAFALVHKPKGEERYALHQLTRDLVHGELLMEQTVARATAIRFARY